MSIETSKKKKGIQMPHTYIILFLIVLVVCLLTYVIPAGQFERQEDASGRMLIVPGYIHSGGIVTGFTAGNPHGFCANSGQLQRKRDHLLYFHHRRRL